MACNLLNSRMPWTSEEDQRLRAAVARYGVKRWSQISALLPGRTSKACSHRWRTYLQPGVMHTSTNPFTEWEVAVVQEAHRALGNNWSAIARMLPGRTNAAVKNFWYAYRRRAQRATGRGQQRRSGATAHVTSASEADVEDDDADVDSGDEDEDEVDAECGSESDGELPGEDLDADGDEDAVHGEDHLMGGGKGVEECRTAEDLGDIPTSMWPQNPDNAHIALFDHPDQTHHQQQQQQQHDSPVKNGIANADKEASPQSPAVAMCASAHTSPVTPEMKVTVMTTADNTDTPGNLSSSCHPSWSAINRQNQQRTNTTAYSGSPEIPPTRESAAGAPPGTRGVSPGVPPNGHSCAGAPPGTLAGTSGDTVPAAADSSLGGTPGDASGTDYSVSLVVPRLSQCVLEVDPATRVGTFSDPMLYVAVEDLSCDDLHQSAEPQAADVAADQALIRDLSGCLVDLQLPGDGASPTALLPDHLLPFEDPVSNQHNPVSQQQQQHLLPHSMTQHNPAHVPNHSIAAATGAFGQYGAASMQPTIFEGNRGAEMQGYRFAAHPEANNGARPVPAGCVLPAAVAAFGAMGVSNSSSSSASMWATDSCSYEHMLLRHSCCSDGGVGSSTGAHSNFGLQTMEQQLHACAARDPASRLLQQQQQQHRHCNEHLNTAAMPAPGMCQVSVLHQQQQQHPKPQLPHRLAKRFCLDLSDEALAAERTTMQL